MSSIKIADKYLYNSLEVDLSGNAPEDISKYGEVKTYVLSPEELERARIAGGWKPPNKCTQSKAEHKKQPLKISKEVLVDKLSRLTVNQVGFTIGVEPEFIVKLAELYCLELDDKGRLKQPEPKGGDMPVENTLNYDPESSGLKKPEGKKTKLDEGREKLPKEKLQAEIKAGKNLTQIGKEYGLHLWVVSKLRFEYGLQYCSPDRSQGEISLTGPDPRELVKVELEPKTSPEKLTDVVSEELAQAINDLLNEPETEPQAPDPAGQAAKVHCSGNCGNCSNTNNTSKECPYNCDRECQDLAAVLKDFSDLKEEFNLLNERFEKLQHCFEALHEFSHNHRHQLFPGLYSEVGVHR